MILSESEMNLFTALGQHELAKLWSSGAIGLYRATACTLFLSQAAGPAVDAFRKAFRYLEADGYRGTPEFNEACKIHLTPHNG